MVADRIDGNKMSWEKANDYCKDDNAILACFNTQNEKDILTEYCYAENMASYGQEFGCWVGYRYENGEFKKLEL